MSEERAGYGGGGPWVRATWTLLRYPDEKQIYDYDLGISALEFANVKELRIERLPDEPAAPHVEVRPERAKVFVGGRYAGSIYYVEARGAEPVYEAVNFLSAFSLQRFPSFEAAVAALVAAAQPAPTGPPMRYLGMELT